jgi:hypothetical protein
MCVRGANEGNTYDFEGTFKNLILTGCSTSQDPSRLSRGTLTLRLIEDGQAMVGMGAIYSPIEGDIFEVKLRIERQT